jgi:hypothetical protein
MDQWRDRKVDLGCGTLALIAFIVVIFSSRTDTGPLMNKLNELEREVQRLDIKLDEISRKLDKRGAE